MGSISSQSEMHVAFFVDKLKEQSESISYSDVWREEAGGIFMDRKKKVLILEEKNMDDPKFSFLAIFHFKCLYFSSHIL